MKNVSPAFRKLDHGEIVPIGYHRVNCYMVFNVKMEDLYRKARLVLGGHVTEPTATITYASVFPRETVSIALIVSVLNNFPVKVTDIQNSYITAPFIETIWKVLGLDYHIVDMDSPGPWFSWRFWQEGHSSMCPLWFEERRRCISKSPIRLYATFGISTMSLWPRSVDKAHGKSWGWV